MGFEDDKQVILMVSANFHEVHLCYSEWSIHLLSRKQLRVKNCQNIL